MAYRREILEEMREFAGEISPDFGPLFGRDVVSLIDDFWALQDENAELRARLI
jgi:hypothetical protein